MKKKLRLIVIAFAVSFIVMAFALIYSFTYYSTLERYSDQVDHTNTLIEHLYKIEGNLKDMDLAERGYMITRDTSYLRTLNTTVDSAYPQTTFLKNLVPDNADEQKNIILIRSDLVLRIGYLKQNLTYLDTTKTNAISSYYHEGRIKMQECLASIRQMHKEETRLLRKVTDLKNRYQHLTFSMLRYILLVFAIITILLFILMVRELRARMHYQDELYAKVIDLSRSHSELEQIAFAASHDLQEPLRKIQVFSNRLLWLKKETMDEEEQNTMQRINVAASRMQELIEDLVNLTSLTKDGIIKEKTNINDVVRSCIEDLKQKIDEKGAVINYEKLPEINGHPKQLNILFKALLDNSLKFSRATVAPEISITYHIVRGEELKDINKTFSHKNFHRVNVSDNGIGFDNKFTLKIFQIFQRLHNHESNYKGQGIGLAICQRVMANHEGYILAYGHIETGATIKLFFPLEE